MTSLALSKSQNVTKGILSIFFGVMLLFVSSVCIARIIDLKINTLHPEPKGSKKKSFNHNLLTDGSINALRMWTRSGAVSWTQPVPVLLSASVSKKFDVKKTVGTAGLVRVHMAMRPKSGVKLPTRIDVYGESVNNQMHHIGKWQKLNKTLKKNLLSDSVWIEIPLTKIYPNIKFVFHSDGRFLSFDELELHIDTERNHSSVDVSPIFEVLTEDSFQRLSKDNKNQLNIDIIPATNSESKVQLQAINAWADFPDADQGMQVDKVYFSNKNSVQLLRLINRSNQKECIELTSDFPMSMSWVEPVLTVSGLKKYDPLLPVKGCKLLPALGFAYLWLEQDGNSPLSEGTLTVKIDKQTVLELLIDAEPFKASAPSCLKVDVWAYQNEKPIWNDKRQAQNLLEYAGVNVFFIPPSKIPIIKSKQSQIKPWQQLNQYVKFYGDGNGQLLLFLGLAKKNRHWDENYLRKWLRKVSKLMASYGYSKERWALYPYDEINAKTYKEFVDFSVAVKRISPKIKIYSNPVYSASSKSSLSQSEVERIVSLSDIVQPDMKLAKQYDAEIFTKNGTEFWIYENPSYPAKSESIRFYRDLPKRVLQVGASGVGFWAFSDTSKSSAWSDIDGRRPDWSSVYDYQDGVIGSRRWSAFKDGVRLACE